MSTAEPAEAAGGAVPPGPIPTRELDMGRELRCGDVVDGCDGVITADSDDEVLRQAAQHAADVHGMTEVDEDTAAAMADAIHDA